MRVILLFGIFLSTLNLGQCQDSRRYDDGSDDGEYEVDPILLDIWNAHKNTMSWGSFEQLLGQMEQYVMGASQEGEIYPEDANMLYKRGRYGNRRRGNRRGSSYRRWRKRYSPKSTTCEPSTTTTTTCEPTTTTTPEPTTTCATTTEFCKVCPDQEEVELPLNDIGNKLTGKIRDNDLKTNEKVKNLYEALKKKRGDNVANYLQSKKDLMRLVKKHWQNRPGSHGCSGSCEEPTVPSRSEETHESEGCSDEEAAPYPWMGGGGHGGLMMGGHAGYPWWLFSSSEMPSMEEIRRHRKFIKKMHNKWLKYMKKVNPYKYRKQSKSAPTKKRSHKRYHKRGNHHSRDSQTVGSAEPSYGPQD